MLLLSLIAPSFAATLQVDPSGGAGVYTTISAAISAARSGDTLSVAAGIYNECLDLNGKNLTIVGAGRNSTQVSGGGSCSNVLTADSGETFALSDMSLINGNQRGLYLVGAQATLTSLTLTGFGNSALSGAAISIEGGSLSLNDSTLSGNTGNNGGAIYASAGAMLDIADSTISSNIGNYGAGLYLSAVGGVSSLTVSNSVISGNTSTYLGAGIYQDAGTHVVSTATAWASNRGYYTHGVGAFVGDGASLSSTGDNWYSNYANYYTSGYYGGAIYASAQATIAISGSSFTGNVAYGGGAIFLNTNATLTVDTSDFSNNVAYIYGGAIQGYYADIQMSGISAVGNRATYSCGGFVYAGNTNVSIEDSTLTSNYAYYNGGALDIEAGNLSLQATELYTNIATYGYGGGLYQAGPGSRLDGTDVIANGNYAYYSGGGAYLHSTTGGVVLSGLEMASNTATYGYGGAIYSYYPVDMALSDVSLTDNLAYYSGGAISMDTYGTLSVERGEILRNRASYGSGGGIFHAPVSSSYDLHVSDLEIANNTAYYYGGGLHSQSVGDVDVQDSRFIENEAGRASNYSGGGAFFYSTQTINVHGSTFCGNYGYTGGGAYSYDASVSDTWSNNIFAENTAAYGGGFLSNASYNQTFSNNTLVGNSATLAGGAVYFAATYSSFINNIVAYTLSGGGLYGYDSATNSYSDFLYNDFYLNSSSHLGGTLAFSTSTNGNRTDSPGLSSYSLDGNCDNDDFSLLATSVLVDAGYPVLLDPDGTVSDIGALGGPGAPVYDVDGDGIDSLSDCDDSDAAIYPGAPESCNGVDDNCDGRIDEATAVDAGLWYADQDGDGFGDSGQSQAGCTAPVGFVATGGDCDDSRADRYPGNTEIPYDGIDQDCTGADLQDVDGDGFVAQTVGGDDCDDNNAAIYPGATEIWYDGIDQNCDGANDNDADGDGQEALDVGGIDCDDNNAAVYQGAADTWYDSVDSDCAGNSDYDADSDGQDALAYGGTDCDDNNAAVYLGAADTWYDGVDSDCAGNSDYDADLDGHDTSNNGGDDCNDNDASIYTGAPDAPNDGIDQDCIGEATDLDQDGYASIADGGKDCNDQDARINPGVSETWYDGIDQNCDELSDYDQDGDGGDSADYAGTDCNDQDPNIYAGAPEIPYDGIDQDCLEGDLYDQDGDGFIGQEAGGDDCDDLAADIHPGAEEVVNDGLDNDCDGISEEAEDIGDTASDTPLVDEGKLEGGGGCGCASTGQAAWAPLLLGAGLLLGRRRK